MLRNGRLRPLFDEGDAGGSAPAPSASDPMPAAAGQVADTADDMKEAIKRLGDGMGELSGHLQTLIAEVVKLRPIEAAKEIPVAAAGAANTAGAAAGNVASAAGNAAGAIPAAGTDVLEAGQTAAHDAGAAASSVVKRRKLKRRKAKA